MSQQLPRTLQFNFCRILMVMIIVMALFEPATCIAKYDLADYDLKKGDKIRFNAKGYVWTEDGSHWFQGHSDMFKGEEGTVENVHANGGVVLRMTPKGKYQNKKDLFVIVRDETDLENRV